MKNSISVFSILLALGTVSVAPARAGNLGPQDRPQSLICNADVDGVRPRNQPIEIQGLDTEAPYLLGMDASTDAVRFDGNVLEFISNNGCDNNFDIVFFAYDLLKIKRGDLKTIRGFMSFFNGDGIEGTAVLNCQ